MRIEYKQLKYVLQERELGFDSETWFDVSSHAERDVIVEAYRNATAKHGSVFEFQIILREIQIEETLVDPDA